MTPEFLLTTLVVVATPGTGVLFTLAAGLARGSRAAVVAAVGCTLGTLPHLLAAITGLAAVLHTSAVAFQTLKYLGVAYLLWMAWQTWRDREVFAVRGDATPVSPWRVVGQGVLINLLNPKLTIFFFAFLPQFVAAGEPDAVRRMLGLSGVFVAATFVIFVAYGVFAGAVRAQVISRPRLVGWLRRGFAASFALLAGRLALAER